MAANDPLLGCVRSVRMKAPAMMLHVIATLVDCQLTIAPQTRNKAIVIVSRNMSKPSNAIEIADHNEHV